MKRILSTVLLACAFFLSQNASAQYGSFGEDSCPEDSTAVDDLIYYGEMLDMSNGYQVGETVFDFTVYDFDGNSLNLYEELSGDKPVVLINGSVSCLRFRGTFEPGNNGQQYLAARNYLEDHHDDVNWIFIYGVEAHPTDGNCPSNCPPTVSNDTTVVQPPFYVNRRWAARGWEESPEHDFPFTMYADNPNNAVYNNFFQRPFGMLAIDCDGTVALRGDWVNSFFMSASSVAQLDLWRSSHTTCSIDWEEEEDNGEGNENDSNDEDSDDDGNDDGNDDVGNDDEGNDDEGNDDEGNDDEGNDDEGNDDEGNDENDDDAGLDEGPTEALTGENTTGGATSGISSETIKQLVVYPNPTQGEFQVSGMTTPSRIMLLDIGGRVILDAQTSQSVLRADAQGLAPGRYVLIVAEQGIEPYRSALIIQ
jgi:hypothetical protein